MCMYVCITYMIALKSSQILENNLYVSFTNIVCKKR